MWSRGLSLRQAALVAGFTYLLNPVTFAEGYVMSRLLSADPTDTVKNLTAHPHLFSAAVLSYVVSAIGDVIMASALYALLRPVSQAFAGLGSLPQLVYAAVWLAAIRPWTDLPLGGHSRLRTAHSLGPHLHGTGFSHRQSEFWYRLNSSFANGRLPA